MADNGHTTWLTDVEMRAWRAFAEMTSHLFDDFDADLRPHGLTVGDYEVLVHLSESGGQALRMCDLAERLRLSPSGLTRRLDGLVRARLVERRPGAQDRRVTLAVLTDTGRERLDRAAPDHVASVRRHFLDHLSTGQLKNLGAACDAVRRGRAEAVRRHPGAIGSAVDTTRI